MSYFPSIGTFIENSPSQTAFGNLRVANPLTIFDSQNQFNKSPFLWEDVLTGSGTTTHLPNESTVKLDVTTVSGDKVVRQTHAYHRYQPGKSQLTYMTCVPGAIKANTRQRWGYFDAQNGVFWEQDGTNLKVVERTFTGGSASDANAVNQSSWNLDKLDGTGPSGVTLDTTKANIFTIDIQWLGVGRVRMGITDTLGQVIYCHEFRNANSFTTVYMTTANLPLRFELENTGTAASGTTLRQICASVTSEGGFEVDRGYPFGASNGITTIAVTTRRPVLSIRPRLTLNSITNRSIQIARIVAAVRAITNDAFVEIVYGGLPSRISLTGASWVNVDTNNSRVEYDVSATAISGGTVVADFFAVTGGGSGANTSAATALRDIAERIALTLDVAGTTQDILSVVVTSFTGTSTCSAVLQWFETY
jgi:hypothetical protein